MQSIFIILLETFRCKHIKLEDAMIETKNEEWVSIFVHDIESTKIKEAEYENVEEELKEILSM